MLKAHCVRFLILGSFFALMKNSYQEAMWHMPEVLPFSDPFEDLMTSSSERRPFLMFASSQKPPENHSAPTTTTDKHLFTEKTLFQTHVKPYTKQKNFENIQINDPQKNHASPSNQPPSFARNQRPHYSPTQHIKIQPQQRAPRNGNHHTVRFMPPIRSQPKFQRDFHPRTSESTRQSLTRERTPNKSLIYTPTSSPNDRSSETRFPFSGHSQGHQYSQTNENQNSVPMHNPNGENEKFQEHVITVKPEYASFGPSYEHESTNDEGRKFLIFHATPVATGREIAPHTFDTHQKQGHEDSSNVHHNAQEMEKLQPIFKQNLQEPGSSMQTVLVHNSDVPSIVIDLVPLRDGVNIHPHMSNHPSPPRQHPEIHSLSPKDSHQISASSRDSVRNHLHERPDHKLALLHQVRNSNDFDTSTGKYPTPNDLPFLEPEIITSATPSPTTFRPLSMSSPIIVAPPPPPKLSSTPKKQIVHKKKTVAKKSKTSTLNLGFLSAEGSFGQNVPGRPGADFPVYNEIPFTNFQCRDYTKPGFYADLEAGCQIFHNCDTTMKKHSFLCPNGTIFHQELFICDWWYNVNCDDAPHFYNLNAGLYATPLTDKQKTGKRENKNP